MISTVQEFSPRRIDVVLKTVERCNIACSYCYVFFGGDESYKNHPKYISRRTIGQLAHFLRVATADFRPEVVSVIFHGGEPTMQRRDDFDWMCSHLRNAVEPLAQATLGLQTNAILVDERWIQLFEKHQIHVGVSIDGPADYHDAERVDHRGRGTFARVMEGVTRLREAAGRGRIPNIGALCVAQPGRDGRRLYRFFAHEMEIKVFDLMLPNETHDSFARRAGDPAAYGILLGEVFDAWAQDDDPSVRIRFFESMLAKLRGFDSYIFPHSDRQPEAVAIGVASDGSLSLDDMLRVVPGKLYEPMLVGSVSLRDFLRSALFVDSERFRRMLPTACEACCWSKLCGGGPLVNRHSVAAGFDNPSIVCDGLRSLYGQVVAYLLRNGYSRTRMMDALGLRAS
jgi:uncharacterized protein